VWSDVNTELIPDAAVGLTTLGMFSDAETELLQIPPNANNYVRALHELLRVRLALEYYEGAIQVGIELLRIRPESRFGIFQTSLAFTFAGLQEEARDLMAGMPDIGEHDPSEAYQMACFESRSGKFADALEWLESALRRSVNYRAKALIDSDLRPLWASLGEGSLSIEQAHVLLCPVFDDLRQWARDSENDPELDGNDLHQFPEAWRELFRFVPSGALTRSTSLQPRNARKLVTPAFNGSGTVMSLRFV